ncbi:hypothetical protein F0562_022513 [Nyssa sinensis]|uniref:Uncharacterized protein n=1 Tax=Nyssa sinensis TaxID=561372 RepID=A0A5J5BRT6_9ASTE|nr:hypothetical protein F0562_022513 [Nyssa sinensis]
MAVVMEVMADDGGAALEVMVRWGSDDGDDGEIWWCGGDNMRDDGDGGSCGGARTVAMGDPATAMGDDRGCGDGMRFR